MEVGCARHALQRYKEVIIFTRLFYLLTGFNRMQRLWGPWINSCCRLVKKTKFWWVEYAGLIYCITLHCLFFSLSRNSRISCVSFAMKLCGSWECELWILFILLYWLQAHLWAHILCKIPLWMGSMISPPQMSCMPGNPTEHSPRGLTTGVNNQKGGIVSWKFITSLLFQLFKTCLIFYVILLMFFDIKYKQMKPTDYLTLHCHLPSRHLCYVSSAFVTRHVMSSVGGRWWTEEGRKWGETTK